MECPLMLKIIRENSITSSFIKDAPLSEIVKKELARRSYTIDKIYRIEITFREGS